MADPEHLRVLKQGVRTWNLWRASNPGLRPDLSSASLVGHLFLNIGNIEEGIDLSDTNLEGADLRGAEFHFANLERANLSLVRFRAYRDETNLVINSSLRGATLDAADLASVAFLNTDFGGAHFSRTVFGRTLFRNVTGLQDTRHYGPSFLDHWTLINSWPLPLQFLRGCGLPDNYIEFLPSLAADAIQFYSCFISYSCSNHDFADRLYADLQNNGVRCWFAPHDMKSGRKLHEQIDEAIQLYDRLLLILSEESMGSEWVKTEIAHARQKELRGGRRVLFPVSLVPFATIREWRCFDADTGKDTAREIREYFIPDFANWKSHDLYRVALDRLLRDLKSDGTTSPATN